MSVPGVVHEFGQRAEQELVRGPETGGDAVVNSHSHRDPSAAQRDTTLNQVCIVCVLAEIILFTEHYCKFKI